MKFQTIYPITAAQIDASYRLTIDGILSFYENTVARYLTVLGLAAFDLQKDDKTWVITEINLEQPEPSTMWSEEVEMTVWISEMTPLRVWLEFEAREVHSGKVSAKGNGCWSLISMSERKLVPCGGLIPESEFVKELAGSHRRRGVVKHAEDAVATLMHTVNRIDLDFNGHTNNRRYVQMALSCFDDTYLSERRPDFLNIRFIHESRIGDEIETLTHPTDDPSLFVSRVLNSRGEEICHVLTHWREKEAVPDISDVNLIRNPAFG